MGGSSSFRRFLKELFSMLTLAVLLLFFFFISRVAVVNLRLALALLAIIVAYISLMVLGAILKKLRAKQN
ncbi:MAG: hypothetical protein QXN05_02195 [Acidilobaceae archaeon]